jgi:flagellum-specific peptidoglycan hydrolase FlgJ
MIDYQLRQGQSNVSNRIPPILEWIGKYWFQLVVSLFLFHLYYNREIQLFVNPTTKVGNPGQFTSNKEEKAKASLLEDAAQSLATVVNIAEPVEDKPAKPPGKWKSSDFNNLSFIIDPQLAAKKGVDDALVAEKMEACRSYVERFAASAISEMKQYDIPASITLAQGLLETNAGDSRLAIESNNHFGIKCRTKCRHCTCRNYSDDDVYDMFRVFDTSWESFREHSILLSNQRYKHLKKLGKKDYKGWAAGLKKAGYATDKNYDKKLIRIIEELDLYQFDY